ncbi:MAG: SGNH/GDSL hydrolase family protein [Candidatus Thorarchaeota archaeon]|jgi:lysophospholipase L1-like esterase
MKILGFGDSLTAGTPGYEPGYGGDVRSQYGFWLIESARNEGITTLQFHNQGVPGELATLMAPRIRKLLERNQYDLAIILAGTNDLGWGRSVDAVFQSVQRLWNICLELDVRLIACTIPPIAMEVPHHQALQRNLNEKIIAGEDVPSIHVVDVFSRLASERSLLLPVFDSGDGLHLSVEGYRAIGELLWKDVVRDLKKSS